MTHQVQEKYNSLTGT